MSAERIIRLIEKNKDKQKEFLLLLDIVRSCGLQETIKWGMPVYVHNNKNIVSIGVFKNFVSLWFFQGALLTDRKNKLIISEGSKAKALRQWRFADYNMVKADHKLIVAYIKEAIRNCESGKEIKPKKNNSFAVPDELVKALNADKSLKVSFGRFPEYKKREFSEYIFSAKKAETKTLRIRKIIPLIMKGVGLNDKYRKQ